MKKSIIILQDLPCFTKASINISLPLLEAMDIDSAVLPLTLISTQSDGFENLYMKDLSEDCSGILTRFAENGFSFDAFLSGYLSASGQYDVALSAMKLLRKDALMVIDPVLGDDGVLYSGFTDEHVALMRSYIKNASVITPNWTEACLLTGKNEVDDILSGFSSLTEASVVITSVPLEKDSVSTVVSEKGAVRVFTQKDLKASVPGSGDLFCACLTGKLLSGMALFPSAECACRVTSAAIER
ncbi:MAG: bifunctional hydroxymethylpyrimidine kinase/phosphomethylpyrimidine kinase, partial [Bullifex sp.]